MRSDKAVRQASRTLLQRKKWQEQITVLNKFSLQPLKREISAGVLAIRFDQIRSSSASSIG